MFHDDAQAARALRALLGMLGLQDLWSEEGPTPHAAALRCDPGGAPLTRAQHVLVQVAWALWDRETPAPVLFDDVIRHLDRPTGAALFSLMLATLEGPAAVDAWLAALSPAEGEHAGSAAAWADELGKDWPTLDLLSLRYIRAVIERQQGNQARAAEVLGVDRRTLSRVLAKAKSGRVPAMQTRR